MPVTEPITAEEVFWMNIPNKRVELVRGRLVVREPPGSLHGLVAMNVAFELKKFADAHGLGTVFAAETGFHICHAPDTVRAPDAAFVRAARLPDPLPVKYFPGAPDIAVEVLSPDDRRSEVADKAKQWIDAGAQLLWVIDPVRRNARVHRPDGSTSELAEGDVLDGNDVLPGFACPLNDVLR